MKGPKEARQKTMNVGVIGLGDCSLNRFLPQLANDKRYKLASVVEIASQQEKLSALGRSLGRNASDVRYTKLLCPFEQIPEDFYKGLDIVYVASPNEYHLPQTIRSLYNPVLTVVEKPLVVSKQELAGLMGVVEKENSSDKLVVQDHYTLKPPSLYAIQKIPEWVRKYGQIEGAKVTFFEEGNLVGQPREKWLISPSAGGGDGIDVGVHGTGVLVKVLGADFTRCEKVEVYDMYPNHKFQCETGFYAEYIAEGEHFAPTERPNVIMKIAKGVKNHQAKTVEVKLERANLTLDYNTDSTGSSRVILRTDSGGHKEIKLKGHEYRTLLDELFKIRTESGGPYLTLEDARKSLGAIFMAYDKIGGVSNMKLERTFSAIEDFVYR